jgi:hypothetical protein
MIADLKRKASRKWTLIEGKQIYADLICADLRVLDPRLNDVSRAGEKISGKPSLKYQ